MKNLKKLIYQYKYLQLELGEFKEQHPKLINKFESTFKEVLPKQDLKVDKNNSVKEKKQISSNVKKIFKDTAKQLHPDKGGDEERFKELNERYKSNDLLGVVDFAIENDIEFELSENDENQLIESIDNVKRKIDNLKGTLAYVWEYGTPEERVRVIQTLSSHFSKNIDINDLSDEIKDKLDFKAKK